ncbi:hypothetical protein KE480_07160 [Enterococcus sp. 079]|nr:hypothetical protein [Enterococcus sp. 079]
MIKRPPINYLERKKILGTKIKAIRKSKKLTQPAFGLMINNGQLIDKNYLRMGEGNLFTNTRAIILNC